MKKFLILGHGGHGKDAVASLLQQIYGLNFQSSSWAAAEKAVFPVLRLVYGYETVQECYEDRRNCRPVWKQLITMYNTPDKARLCREILKDCDIYVGMRCAEEYAASKHMFAHIFWVDGSNRVGDDVTMTIPFDPKTMIRIDNNGDEDQLPLELAYVNCLFTGGVFA